jgi:hypothetical protein
MRDLFADAHIQAIVLLVAGAIALLISVLVVSRAMFSEAEISPGRRALAHWLPIATAFAIALGLRRVDIAVGYIFGTNIVVLSAVLGFVALARPIEPVAPMAKRIWPFLILPVVLTLLLGFQAILSTLDIGILVIQGVASLLIWRATPGPVDVHPLIRIRFGFSVVEIILGLAMAVIGAFAATRGAVSLAKLDGGYPAGVLAATLLSIVLAMPMVSTGIPLAIRGEGWASITAQVGVVFLNLGVLLPAAVLFCNLNKLIQRFYPVSTPATSASQPVAIPFIQTLFPWRIHSVILVLLALLLIPISAGRIKLDKRLGTYLIFGYAAYLLVTLIISTRG